MISLHHFAANGDCPETYLVLRAVFSGDRVEFCRSCGRHKLCRDVAGFRQPNRICQPIRTSSAPVCLTTGMSRSLGVAQSFAGVFRFQKFSGPLACRDFVQTGTSVPPKAPSSIECNRDSCLSGKCAEMCLIGRCNAVASGLSCSVEHRPVPCRTAPFSGACGRAVLLVLHGCC